MVFILFYFTNWKTQTFIPEIYRGWDFPSLLIPPDIKTLQVSFLVNALILTKEILVKLQTQHCDSAICGINLQVVVLELSRDSFILDTEGPWLLFDAYR